MANVSSSNGLEKYPKLRFLDSNGQEFSGWTRTVLGTIIVPFTEKVFGDHNYEVLTSSRNGIQRQSEHFAGKQRHDTDGYNIIPRGYCTYRNRSDDGLFTFNMNNIVDEGIVSKFYPVFTFQNANSTFMMEYLNGSPRVRAKLSVLAVGTSQVVLSFETLKETSFYLPIFEEQNRIASLLSTLNERIEKQRLLIEHLKKYKRGLSESIFSSLLCPTQELSKVCDIIGGGTPDTGVLEYWNGEIYWFTPTEVGKKKYVVSSSRTITNEGLIKSSAKMLPPQTVLLTTRATLGEMSITTTACCTNQGFQSLVAKKDVVLPEYLYYLQTIIKPWCEKYSSGNTFREISKSALGKCAVPVPSIKEQTRIVDCLSLVDTKIENCELVLENLTTMKSALVQCLFI